MRPKSEVIIALGSRTTILHPEIKRHRAWWKEILRSRVYEKIANRVSSPAAAAKVITDFSGFAEMKVTNRDALLVSTLCSFHTAVRTRGA